jgi:H+/Cl- antiporter ClcA
MSGTSINSSTSVPQRGGTDSETAAPSEPADARRVRVLWASALAGAVGGLVSAAYLGVLALGERFLWPAGHSRLLHWGLLIAAGAVISVLLAVLGDPGETGVFIDSVHVDGGPMGLRPLRSLVPVSLLGIAVGGGIGPEPALMQTTGTVGSWIGRRLSAGPAELRVITVTGMASGLTVLFSAPLGAAVFALEILHRKGLEYYEALLPACVGSLASYGVYILLTGRGLSPEWRFPSVSSSLNLPDLLLGAVGGLAGALIAHIFGFLIRTCTRLAGALPPWGRPPAAGIALGALAYLSPYGLTFGEAQLAQLLRSPAVTATALVLALSAHLLGAAITIGGRWKGGIIIPMFFVGYCLGRATAMWSGDEGRALVLAAAMMVACNVGMTKTPLGSTLVVSQMTGMLLIPPMLIAALVSLALTTGVGFVGGQRGRDVSPGRDRGVDRPRS